MHALQLGGDLTLAGMPGRGVTALLCFDLSGEASDPPQETAEAAEAALPRFRAPPPLQLHGFAQQRRPRKAGGMAAAVASCLDTHGYKPSAHAVAAWMQGLQPGCIGRDAPRQLEGPPPREIQISPAGPARSARLLEDPLAHEVHRRRLPPRRLAPSRVPSAHGWVRFGLNPGSG